MGPAFGLHLGSRVSALLDGQLPPTEEERAWRHVRTCASCRDLVEREGWIKTQLAGLSFGPATAPAHLKGSLVGASAYPADPAAAVPAVARGHRVALGVVGGGVVGAAVAGVLLLSAPAAQAPGQDRRLPATSLSVPTSPAMTPQAPAHRRDLPVATRSANR